MMQHNSNIYLLTTFLKPFLNHKNRLHNFTGIFSDFVSAHEIIYLVLFSPEIPKLMHQIWNDEHVPDKWKHAIESCRRMNPDYKYKLWTMKEIEELVRKEYSWFTATFTGESSVKSDEVKKVCRKFAMREIGVLKSNDSLFFFYMINNKFTNVLLK